jgi:hypothetical protein
LSQFYITAADPKNDVQRCRNAQIAQVPITVTGANEKGEISAYSGVIQFIEDCGESAAKGRRWRVTILDEAAN